MFRSVTSCYTPSLQPHPVLAQKQDVRAEWSTGLPSSTWREKDWPDPSHLQAVRTSQKAEIKFSTEIFIQSVHLVVTVLTQQVMMMVKVWWRNKKSRSERRNCVNFPSTVESSSLSKSPLHLRPERTRKQKHLRCVMKAGNTHLTAKRSIKNIQESTKC